MFYHSIRTRENKLRVSTDSSEIQHIVIDDLHALKFWLIEYSSLLLIACP